MLLQVVLSYGAVFEFIPSYPAEQFLWDTDLARVVRMVDNGIHWIILYPADGMVCFVFTHPLDSDLSGGERYSSF